MNCTSITTTFKWNEVLLCVVNVICTIAGTILNSVVILSLWNSQLRRKLCYFMIFILACSDLAVVVVIHPLIIFKTASCWMSVDVIEQWIKYSYSLCGFSWTALLIMTLERYLALLYPFFHKKFVTKSRLMISFVLIPLLIIIFRILNHKKNWDLVVIVHAVNGFVFLVMCIMNFKLFFVARTLRKRAVVTLGNLDGSDSEPGSNLDSKKFKRTFSSLGKISTCLLAVVCLIICYLPWIIYSVVNVLNASIIDQNKFISESWIVTFVASNSSLNCLIFFYKNSVLRRHGENFVKTCFCRRLRLNNI